jgi:hypothetical protein
MSGIVLSGQQSWWVVVPESVELATILLTDLVGSTRLANSVGPAPASTPPAH